MAHHQTQVKFEAISLLNYDYILLLKTAYYRLVLHLLLFSSYPVERIRYAGMFLIAEVGWENGYCVEERLNMQGSVE